MSTDNKTSTMEKIVGGRRLDDKLHMAIMGLVVLGWPLSLFFVTQFYADVPKELQSFREDYVREAARTQAALARLTEITSDQNETLKSMVPLRERMALVEQEQRQQALDLLRHEKRLDKLEEKSGFFGGKK